MEDCRGRGSCLDWNEQLLQRPYGGSTPGLVKDQQGSHWAGMDGEEGRVGNAVRTVLWG